jgi:hypothetical protein
MSARRLRQVAGPWLPGVLYGAGLLFGSALLAARDDAGREALLAAASSNLENLHHDPIATLAGSAFLVPDDLVVWTLLALLGLVTLGLAAGAWRATVLVVAVHVLATLLSEGVLAWRIHSGALPGSARRVIDVGPSYVVVGALVASAVHTRGVRRWAAAAGFVALTPFLFDGLTEGDLTAVGHACTVVLAALLGLPLVRSVQRNVVRPGEPMTPPA